jgi:excisionase family DNA binding protein
MIDNYESLFTPEQVASYLKVSRQTVYGLIRSGKLEAMHIGRIRRISTDHLRSFILKSGSY